MERKKYVDESWKESATQEKEQLDNMIKQNPEESNIHIEEPLIDTQESESLPEGIQQEMSQSQQPESKDGQPSDQAQASAQADGMDVNFINYMTGLAFQALIFLGEIPNPITNKVEKNIQQAKMLIDTLRMLKEKTKGNLN